MKPEMLDENPVYPYITVDYEEFKPETYNGIIFLSNSEDTLQIKKGNFFKDIEELEKLLKKRGVKKINIGYSLNSYLTDVFERRYNLALCKLIESIK